jgi:hypothetical protein
VQWTINGTPATASGGDPLRVAVPRSQGKKVVRATLGSSSQELTVWAVWSNIAASGTPAITPVPLVPNATRFFAQASVNFTATILPPEIITDPDHPDLSGGKTTDPPDNGTQICGRPLAGGANRKWDISRQTRQNVINPAGLVPIPASDACLWTNISYPANRVEGNDDTHPGDETNDPYANSGTLTSNDTPSDFVQHSQGRDGNTLELRFQFQELARLELNSRWWLISDLFPWRFHIKTRKDAATHRWADNGTDAALDNTGF